MAPHQSRASTRNLWLSLPVPGVNYDPTCRNYVARVYMGKELKSAICVGRFLDAEEAARAHDAKARELLGDPKLNFPGP
jgi:hypothetical protein